MRYQIPQFIDIEDKIFGPFSFKQFLYLIGGGAISYVLWKVLPTIIAIIAIAPIAALSVSLAFVKINERPFIFVIQAFFNYLVHPRMYFWRRKTAADMQKEYQENLKKRVAQIPVTGPSTEEKIKTLSEKLDIVQNT